MSGEMSRYAVKCEDVVAGYGHTRILDGVNMCAYSSEIVAILGHNGAGKSTLLKVAFGMLPLWEGRVLVRGYPIAEPNPVTMREAGVVYVPQGQRVFTSLTVRENLELASKRVGTVRSSARDLDRALFHFPELKAKLPYHATTLSGGERQILTLASALMCTPHTVLLDEPSLGLSPRLTSAAFARIDQLRSSNATTFVIVEQRVRAVLEIADRAYVLRRGRVSFSGDAAALRNRETLRDMFV